MEFLGIGIGLVSALLWGSADIVATVAARRLGTFKTTFVSQVAGFLALFIFGLAYAFLYLPFSAIAFVFSLLIGMVTGIFAAFGYFYAYRSLESGPIALVSPLISTSSFFTLLLSLIVLRQSLTSPQVAAVLVSILGVVVASTNVTEIRSLLQTPTTSPSSKGHPLQSFSPGALRAYLLSSNMRGVRWALIATLAFSVMDFGVGASAALSGWFLPVLWTRIFSICALTLLSYWKRRQRMRRIALLEVVGAATTVGFVSTTTEGTPHLSNMLASHKAEELTMVDPEVALSAREQFAQDALAAIDLDAPVIRRPSRRLEALVESGKSTTPLNLLETSLEDTFIIRPFRSYNTLLTLADDASLERRLELSHIDTLPLPQDSQPLAAGETQEAITTSHLPERTLSLSLPTLEELSHLRVPLASSLGLGVLLAIIAGVAENGAVLGFSLDTQVTTTGIASAITSGYSLIVVLFGIFIYHERLAWHQISGIVMFMFGLILLALVK